ncbi:hypothetical protein BDN72DRAFT_891282 [Pluteus cervinus]|uniref:Uncharacterized protein n=1 Tax=Pluteus cervinus TaxID=181527 RepID=A0ACD3BEF2_9AGAR|nr:hypothetical protein BDN72DRAFT_891282 [Pluteus cervinus]
MPLRTSPRLAEKRDSPSWSPAPDSTQQQQPGRKRRRSTPDTVSAASISSCDESRPKKKHCGIQTSWITQVPLDILFEIFQRLEPLDLLHVSYTCKVLHSTLVTRAAAFVWRMAYRNVFPTPPVCPDDVNLMHYANFLYGHHCQFCGSKRGSAVSNDLIIRACAPCVRERFEAPITKDEVNLATNVIPGGIVLPKGNITRYCKEDMRFVREAMKVNISNPEFKSWYDARMTYVSNRRQYGRYVRRWRQDEASRKAMSLAEIRKRRVDAITSRLREIGYGSHIGLVGWAYHQHPYVVQAKELTDSAWNKIKPRLVEFLDAEKSVRLERHRRSILSSRITSLDAYLRDIRWSLPPNIILPDVADYASMEPVKSLIFDTPVDIFLPIQTFDQLRSELLPLGLRWREKNDELLTKLLPKNLRPARGRGTPWKAPLDLAVTFFRCAWCDEPITYPRALVHACLTRRRATPSMLKENEFLDANFSEPWNYGGKQLAFDHQTHNIAVGVITALGEDPMQVKPEQLDVLDRRLECTLCATSARRLAMRWKIAILHGLQHSKVEDTGHRYWRVLDKREAAQVKAIEARDPRHTPDVACTICRTRMPQGLFSQHWRMHTVDAEPQSYIPHDLPVKQPPYEVEIPINSSRYDTTHTINT